MATLAEKRIEFQAKQGELAAIFAAAGPEKDLSKVEELKSFSDTAARVGEIQRRVQELDALGAEIERDVQLERDAEHVKALGDKLTQPAGGIVHPGAGQPRAPEKTLGQLFVESKAYTGRTGNVGPVAELPDVDAKVLFQTTAGWGPETTRTGRVELLPLAPAASIIDYIPKNSTNQAAVVYMAETLFVNAAAETAENGAYGEAALALAEVSSPVRKLTVWIPVTDEQLEDVGYAQSYIENRLTLMLNQRVDSQVLVGDGIAPNLLGINNEPTVLTQALGADVVLDAIYKGIVQVQVTGRANPSAIAINPTDWQDIRLLRTVDGIYILGSPTDVGPTRLWGVPVVVTTAQTVGTAVVGDFATYCEFVLRRGISFQVTNSHGTDFINGRQAVRADFRAAFVIYRPQAFCLVTGI